MIEADFLFSDLLGLISCMTFKCHASWVTSVSTLRSTVTALSVLKRSHVSDGLKQSAKLFFASKISIRKHFLTSNNFNYAFFNLFIPSQYSN